MSYSKLSYKSFNIGTENILLMESEQNVTLTMWVNLFPENSRVVNIFERIWGTHSVGELEFDDSRTSLFSSVKEF